MHSFLRLCTLRMNLIDIFFDNCMQQSKYTLNNKKCPWYTRERKRGKEMRRGARKAGTIFLEKKGRERIHAYVRLRGARHCVWVLTRTCGCSRRGPGPGVIWHQWPSSPPPPRPPSQAPSVCSFIRSLASSRPKLNHNRIMRSDNRLFPLFPLPHLTVQREAAFNPPPLKHLAHYLSVFVFLYLRFLSMKLLQTFVLLE